MGCVVVNFPLKVIGQLFMNWPKFYMYTCLRTGGDDI